MPYKDPDMNLYINRCTKRKANHGNWRQLYVDNNGICQGKNEDGSPCENTEDLEFHEPFGENRTGASRMQVRTLLCLPCHNYEHGGDLHTEYIAGNFYRPHANKLQRDVAFEIEREGSYDNWIKRYDLKERK